MHIPIVQLQRNSVHPTRWAISLHIRSREQDENWRFESNQSEPSVQLNHQRRREFRQLILFQSCRAAVLQQREAFTSCSLLPDLRNRSWMELAVKAIISDSPMFQAAHFTKHPQWRLIFDPLCCVACIAQFSTKQCSNPLSLRTSACCFTVAAIL